MSGNFDMYAKAVINKNRSCEVILPSISGLLKISRYYIVAGEKAHITVFHVSRILLKHSASDA